MSERIPVIMNPAARSFRAGSMVERARSLRPEPELHFTEHAGHATEIAERLANEGRELVVAVGGDGTVNEVLQGLCRVNATRPDPATHTALGTLPAGTMNVFAYEIGFPSHTRWVKPWAVISSGARRSIDLWQANDHYFLQLAGVGLDAEVIRKTTSEAKRKLGPLAYVISAVDVIQAKSPALSLTSAGRPPLCGSTILIGNGRNYGGRFSMFPRAQSNDGLLDVVIFREPLNPWNAAQMVRGALANGYAKSEDLDYLQLAEFVISSDTETAMEVDGELSGCTPVSFRRAPFDLRIAAAALA